MSGNESARPPSPLDVAGPAAHATRRARTLPRPPSRPYPLPLDGVGSGEAVVLAATRALLAVSTRAEAADVLRVAVGDLGGAVVPARLAEAHPDVVHVDVSLGDGEPQLVVVDPLSIGALRLAEHLPTLVEDALRASARCDTERRHVQRAAVDPLTGVATRGEIGPRIGAAVSGDAICMIDLDGFKNLNDTQGHAAGDRALQAFGSLLRQAVRADDFCGRYGGDEFVLVLAGAPLEAARRRMTDLAATWASADGHGTSVSAGVAVVGEAGGSAAVAAADRALYRAKKAGRNRVEVAPEGSTTDG